MHYVQGSFSWHGMSSHVGSTMVQAAALERLGMERLHDIFFYVSRC
jgi:hypothetical protein